MDIARLLQKFPKIRPQLTPGQRDIYEAEYLANREGQNTMSSLAQKLEGWMHRKVAAATQGSDLLEIGAGSLNHIKYISGRSVNIDVVEPMISLYKNSAEKTRIRNFYNDIKESYDKYDTIYSVAALEHITDLPTVIAHAGKALKTGGVFANGIPSEGGFLWGLAWRVSTGLSYKLRTGYSYKTLMRHEHVNNFDEIVALLQYFFATVKLQYFPVPGKHLALYAVVIAREPKLDLCNEYLAP